MVVAAAASRARAISSCFELVVLAVPAPAARLIGFVVLVSRASGRALRRMGKGPGGHGRWGGREKPFF